MVSDSEISKQQRFIASIMIICGLNKSDPLIKKLQFLIRDEQDVQQWILLFNGNIDDVVSTTDDFRDWKLRNEMISLKDFLDLAQNDLKNAMDGLFYEENEEWIMEKLYIKLENNEISLEKIYYLLNNDAWYNSLRKIVKANWLIDI
ncbi:hypothetical protein MH117_03115 [Paenibacillus sp. ACRRX]|uniref:hypothetical protein n=1 Tax=unclassified Paenibacillus TaxID=185978 RepID=UPI001EF6E993|nr:MULTISPECIES: hypothetical protein [unclassified Paenibacillus]MCG7406393.1 hypothetical protein [Paenibacillus sp. ACRRX]MDK8179424.1 hypothetical protein [Paenibacillus sp. UMB4589-SE434]